MPKNNLLNTRELLPSFIKLDKYSWNPLSLSFRTPPPWTWGFSPQTFLFLLHVCANLMEYFVFLILNCITLFLLHVKILSFIHADLCSSSSFIFCCSVIFRCMDMPQSHSPADVCLDISLFFLCWRNCCCGRSQARPLGAWTLFLRRKDGNCFSNITPKKYPHHWRVRAVSESAPVLQVAGGDKGTHRVLSSQGLLVAAAALPSGGTGSGIKPGEGPEFSGQ